MDYEEQVKLALELYPDIILPRIKDERRRYILIQRSKGSTFTSLGKELKISLSRVRQLYYRSLYDVNRVIFPVSGYGYWNWHTGSEE